MTALPFYFRQFSVYEKPKHFYSIITCRSHYTFILLWNITCYFSRLFHKKKTLHNYHKYTWSASNIKFYSYIVVNFLLQLIYNFLFFLCMAMYAKNKEKIIFMLRYKINCAQHTRIHRLTAKEFSVKYRGANYYRTIHQKTLMPWLIKQDV